MHRYSRIYLPHNLWIAFLMLVISILTHYCTALSPRSRVQLKSVVDACLKLSPKGKCFTVSRGPIGTWDVSRVTDMNRMFYSASSFDADISKWDVSQVKDMGRMFSGARSFSGDVSKWDVSKVVNMKEMFRKATAFAQKLCGPAWVRSKANQDAMFEGSPGSISSTVCTPTSVAPLFAALSSAAPVFTPQSRSDLKTAVDTYLQTISKPSIGHTIGAPIGDWDVSRVTDMSGLFHRTDRDTNFFDADISKWDVSRVTDMSRMFYGANFFNGDISQWDVSSVRNMEGMFEKASAFRGDLSEWDVSRVKNMNRMFRDALTFNGELSDWNVSNVESMDEMFYEAAKVTKKLCGAAWVHSKASKELMFEGSSGSISPIVCIFSPKSDQELKTAVGRYLEGGVGDSYGPIGEWDVSRVTDMSNMFFRATEFDGDISKWDVSRVTNMRNMFFHSTAFNGDISKWDVSSVENMEGMFYEASSFNGDLSSWDVSNVRVMDRMFYGASGFTQKLCGAAWVRLTAGRDSMFEGSSGSISSTICTTTVAPPGFSPKSRVDLKGAVDHHVGTPSCR